MVAWGDNPMIVAETKSTLKGCGNEPSVRLILFLVNYCVRLPKCRLPTLLYITMLCFRLKTAKRGLTKSSV